ncbi:MAG: sigma-70 family RNA polymerase sigma factor, partial [Saprospiraceae bacterium]|nr:sigma-70 family RNA polymerase sigma factor [Saprospiraceae bacterium]
IAGRNERAFAVLYDRYGPRMYRYFYRMLWRDKEKAADFTQELFLKIIEKPHLFDPERNFRTWLYSLAINLCKNEYRRPQMPEFPRETPDLWDDSLPEWIDQAVFDSCLRKGIDNLNEAQRQCFVLRFQEELSVAEIAQIVACPEGTVKSRLHHAVRQLREIMAPLNTQ